MNSGFIDRFMNTADFPHAVDKLELIETHISWVVLTGEVAYKIKKPVSLGFVDFSTLARRRHFCEEELRLNRRTTPDMYLDVVPIAESKDGYSVGREPAVEYAVKMRQFPPGAQLDMLLESGKLSGEDLAATARRVAGFHRSLPPMPDIDPAEHLARVRKFTLDNFSYIRSALSESEIPPELSRLENWTREHLERLDTTLRRRALGGFVREGHGDLHLANMVKLEDGIVPFDCLEFNPRLRWIDVISDAAFLAMDLMAHSHDDLAYTFANGYLEQTGDYGGLSVLRFYLVYRALVRAKVSALRLGAAPDFGRYLGLADRIAFRTARPLLLLTHGFSGAGKTWLSGRLAPGLPAIRVRSDLERKRMHGIDPEAGGSHRAQAGIYSAADTDRTYQCLAGHCETGLRAGFNMIADATFLAQRHRTVFLDLAKRLRAKAIIVDCAAENAVLRARIRQREAEQADASDADLAVLDHQRGHHDPLTDQEQRLTVRVETGNSIDVPGLVAELTASD